MDTEPGVGFRPAEDLASKVVVSDGHIEIDRYMFAAMLREGGQITELQHSWYAEQYDNWKVLVPEAIPTHIIYLRVSPETCHKRIHVRGRASEEGLPLSYLQALHNKFEAYAEEVKGRANGPQLLVVNAEQTDDEVFADATNYIREALLEKEAIATRARVLKLFDEYQ